MKLTNQQIYEYANLLLSFKDCDIKIPVRINFYMQKNIKCIEQAAIEIDKMRISIGSQFGVPSPNADRYDIPKENIPVVNQELNDLFTLEQDLNIHMFKLSDFDGIELTYQQMSAIMFMIEED